jgi:hypothetical protein
VPIGAVTSTGFTDFGLTHSTTYTYKVAAFDHAYNYSSFSSTVKRHDDGCFWITHRSDGCRHLHYASQSGVDYAVGGRATPLWHLAPIGWELVQDRYGRFRELFRYQCECQHRLSLQSVCRERFKRSVGLVQRGSGYNRSICRRSADSSNHGRECGACYRTADSRQCRPCCGGTLHGDLDALFAQRRLDHGCRRVGAGDAISMNTNSGNVGVGVSSPNYPLSVSGTFGLSESGGGCCRVLFTTSGGGTVINHLDNSPIYFQTESTSWMTIKNGTGYVGIGTTNPSTALHVVGEPSAATSLQSIRTWPSGYPPPSPFRALRSSFLTRER